MADLAVGGPQVQAVDVLDASQHRRPTLRTGAGNAAGGGAVRGAAPRDQGRVSPLPYLTIVRLKGAVYFTAPEST